ncbi:MAG TPA: hypothetical protein VGM56_28275 [Byssovorax sp.]
MEGAIFCDGQYVDTDDTAACLAALGICPTTPTCSAHGSTSICGDYVPGPPLDCQLRTDAGSCTPASFQRVCGAKCNRECGAGASQCVAQCMGGCQAEIAGACDADAESVQGALFCNGQYLDTADSTACLAALGVCL